MKKNQRASTKDKNSTIFTKINDFISYNTFVVLLLIFGVWFHQIFIVGSTINTLEDNQKKMLHYLKENINKVYFLSATGMVMNTTKSAITYSDERFKSYLANEIIDSLIAGNIVISSNYKKTFTSADNLLLENKRINGFYNHFVAPYGSVIAPYVRSLHRAIVDGKYPEYINTISSTYTEYIVNDPSEQNDFMTEVVATISLKAVVKSWVRDLKEWDTREVEISVKMVVSIDIDKYVNVGNPFGIHFKTLSVPVLHKPTGREIMSTRRK